MQSECLVHAGLLVKPKEKDVLIYEQKRYAALPSRIFRSHHMVVLYYLSPHSTNVPVVSLNPKVKIYGAGQQSTYSEHET